VTDAAVSVVVVSRGRPRALARCLEGLRQLYHRNFEVVVVADPGGMEVARDRPIKAVAFDEANISVARNLGVAAAAGEIVAFIDDDAVPEPTWLDALTAPFADAGVAATGGWVRGRNGISYQWTSRVAGPDGRSRPGDVPGPGEAVKTEGTNMAFRRSVLAGIGGFDPAFRFYLDETDVNLRLARAGYRTVIVPGAQVHHGFAASAIRRSDRVPMSLRQIGASLAVFLRRHGDGVDRATRLSQEREEQRRRLIRHMVAARLMPGDVARLLQGFDAGCRDGAGRTLGDLPALGGAVAEFRPFGAVPGTGHVVIAGRVWQARAKRRAAAEEVGRGRRVTLILLSPTARRHRVAFTSGGWWEQAGGLFGAAERTEPAMAWWRFGDRVGAEAARAGGYRIAGT